MKMKLTQYAVTTEMAASMGNREAAAAKLRRLGYRFANAAFRELARDYVAEVIPKVATEDHDTGPVIGGELEAPDKRREVAQGHTFVFTCAQNNTYLHDEFFEALVKYCEARDAELHISRFTYNKAAYGKGSVKPGSKRTSDADDMWYDPRIAPYVSDVPLQITPDLIWCGELNVMPTASNPLSAFKKYTRQASGIVPHVKLAMESIPTMKSDPVKFMYTTGTVTQRNYIQKASGQVADFHHVFGALVVEVAEDGTWWARQINADSYGGFYDLTTYWTADGVTGNGPTNVAAITHGDIHWAKADHAVLGAMFDDGGILDALSPNEQFFHDTIDFTARNHHNINDPHFLHNMHVQGSSSVESEFSEVGDFLSYKAYREGIRNYIVVSNHDQAIETWLRNSAAMYDPVNAGFWHLMNLYCYQMRQEGMTPRPFAKALSTKCSHEFLGATRFLHEDDSYRIFGDIETGLHGHLGPNGARGTPRNLSVVGKANTAHTHSAGIVDGVYTAGVFGKLDMGYNKGLSSWSHSFIVTYQNGKRAILTIKAGKAWRDR